MIKILIFALLLSFPIFILIYLRQLKRKTVKTPQNIKTESNSIITYVDIEKKSNIKQNHSETFSFDISTIILNDNTYDFLITLTNNLGKHVRIDIKEVILSTNQTLYNGDFSFLDLTLGTNDYILKNTIIDNGNLIRNIHFKINEDISIKHDDYITIKLNVNNNPLILRKSINESSVKKVKIIKEG